nr:homoserine o-acetyltransferase [Quercus suber]
MTEAYSIYNLGDFALKEGGTIPSAHLAYKTYGDPSLPAIIYPTWFSGLIASNEWLIGAGKALDPAHYYIIVPALFGNGESSSPSNTPALRPFPPVRFHDNVRAQHQLVTAQLGVTHARAVVGWSMGAAQTFQWATQYPSFMELVVPFCGAARTSLHNRVFLEGVKSALLGARGRASAGVGTLASGAGAPEWSAAEREVGLKALGRVYAGWGFSQAFYRARLYESALGFGGLEEFMVGFWEKWALEKGTAGRHDPQPIGLFDFSLADGLA